MTDWPDEAAVERAVREHYQERLNWRGHGPTFEENCVIPGWFDSKCDAMRAAFRAAGPPETSAVRSGLDRAWRAVDALGGTWPRPLSDGDAGYQRGYTDALDNACEAIEKLGAVAQ